MRQETTNYRTERKKYVTRPRVFVRPFFVRKHGDGTEYAFSRDLSTHTIKNAVTPKLICLAGLAGNAQSVDPISCSSTVGALGLDLVDVGGEVMRLMSDPARPLLTAIGASRVYVLKAANSELTGGADFNKELSPGTETANTIAVSVAASATEDSYGFTKPGDPAGSGGSGQRAYSVELNVTVANTNLFITFFVSRVSSTGTVLAGPVQLGSELSLGTTGVKSIGAAQADLGAFGTTDRVRVTYRFRNAAASVQSVTIETGTTDTEFTAPWDIIDHLLVDDARGYPAIGSATLGLNGEDVKYTKIIVKRVVDHASAGLHGTTQGEPTFGASGVVPFLQRACLFDGVDDYVEVSDNDRLDFDFNKVFSVECWVRTTQVPGSAVSIVEKWSNTGAFPYAVRLDTDGKVSARRSDGTNVPVVTSAAAINDGKWHHVVFAKDNATLRLYVDGVQVATATDTTTTTTTNASSLFIGRRGATAGTFFAGHIAQVVVYGSIISAARVTAHWSAYINGPKGALEDAILVDMPLGYWKLDDDLNAFAGTLTRGARGSTVAAAGVGTLVRNGEQLRRGVRVTVFTGYAPLDEADYGPSTGFVKMEIQNIEGVSSRHWRANLAGIQRFVKRLVFEKASSLNPTVLGPENPIDILLKVLLSTGTGTNGPYDVLQKENGAAVPQQLVDVDRLEGLRDILYPDHRMRFDEIAPISAKEFIEQQILRPLNLIPVESQDGKYAARSIRQPEFLRSATVAGNAFPVLS